MSAPLSAHPWDVYAEQLFPCGHGYPLWNPEHAKHGGVHIGDVGYLHNGHFCRMFNAMRAKDDEINMYGVPEAYTPFAHNAYLKEISRDDIPAGPLCSVGVTSTAVHAENKGKGTPEPLTFHCEKARGAVLVMKEPATREELHPSRTMMAYMRTNYQSWVAFAQSLGLQNIGADDLLFVRGWVKTADWAVATFSEHDHAHSTQLTFRGLYGVPPSAAFIAGSSKDAPLAECNLGPLYLTHTRRASRNLSQFGRGLLMKTPPERDQCVFLQYYRLKTRSSRPEHHQKAQEAGAPQSESSNNSEAHLLKDKPAPPLAMQGEPITDPRRSSKFFLSFGRRSRTARPVERRKSAEARHHLHRATSEKQNDPVFHHHKPYDPLTSVLDFILAKSDAEIAIVTNTRELAYLSQDLAFPRNLHVRVDEGLGSVAYNSIYARLNLKSAIHYCLHALPCEDLFDDYAICDNLAVLLSASFHELHDTEDLEEAIEWCKYSVDRSQPNHQNRRIALLRNLTVLFQIRYNKSRQMEDLDQAIAYCREAQGHCPPNHIMRLSLVSMLAYLLEARGTILHRSKDKREATKYREEQSILQLPDNYQEDASYTETFVESWFRSGSERKGNTPKTVNIRQLGTLLSLLGDWPDEIRLKDTVERLDHALMRDSTSISKDVFTTLVHSLHRLFHFEIQLIATGIKCLTLPMGREGRYKDDPAEHVLNRMLERACRTRESSQSSAEIVATD